MLQFIVQFLPLIFLCAAFGVVLLNFDAVAEYVVYVISMLVQPKELLHVSNELAVPLPPQTQKKKFSLFRPIIRVWTLFNVLFFPDLDLGKLTGRKHKSSLEDINVYSEKTKQEIDKYSIKTYSVPDAKNIKNFRSALDPLGTTQPSSAFQQAFPDVVNIINKINKIDSPPVATSTIYDTLPDFQAYTGGSTPPPPVMEAPAFPPQVRTTEVVVPTQIPEPGTTMQVEEIIPPIARTIPTGQTENAEPEKFDAIAALERKVSELKKDKVSSVVSQVNYGELAQRSNEVNSTKISMPSIQPSAPLPKITTTPTATTAEEIHIVNESALPRVSDFSILPMIGKVITYTILSLPLLIVVGSIGYYLVLNKFNLGSLAGYPGWVSTTLEAFVKAYILRQS